MAFLPAIRAESSSHEVADANEEDAAAVALFPKEAAATEKTRFVLSTADAEVVDAGTAASGESIFGGNWWLPDADGRFGRV